MNRLRGNEQGFTLVELVMAVLILGIMMVPLGAFAESYFRNYPTDQQRLSDSHDIQLAAAYFSQDVANAGLYSSTAPFGALQSVWTSASLPATYCGQGLGTTKLVMGWYKYNATITGGPATASVAYIVEGSTLHRVYCENGSATPISDATVVHNLVSATPQCLTSAGVDAVCSNAPFPPRVRLTLSISGGSNDDAAPAQPVTLDGLRRQS